MENTNTLMVPVQWRGNADINSQLTMIGEALRGIRALLDAGVPATLTFENSEFVVRIDGITHDFRAWQFDPQTEGADKILHGVSTLLEIGQQGKEPRTCNSES